MGSIGRLLLEGCMRLEVLNRTYAGECLSARARGFGQPLSLSLFLLICSCTQQNLDQSQSSGENPASRDGDHQDPKLLPGKVRRLFRPSDVLQNWKRLSVDPDSNADGLSDVEAVALGVNPNNQPTTGITDYLAVEFLGISPTALSTIPHAVIMYRQPQGMR